MFFFVSSWPFKQTCTLLLVTLFCLSSQLTFSPLKTIVFLSVLQLYSSSTFCYCLRSTFGLFLSFNCLIIRTSFIVVMSNYLSCHRSLCTCQRWVLLSFFPYFTNFLTYVKEMSTLSALFSCLQIVVFHFGR